MGAIMKAVQQLLLSNIRSGAVDITYLILSAVKMAGGFMIEVECGT